MTWWNVGQRAGLDYCVNDNFRGTFVYLCSKILTPERINCYVDLCLQNLEL